MGLISKFKDLFFDFEPDKDDHYIIEKWKKEAEEADRLKDLHLESRKQINTGLTIEDFERAKQTKKQKNKTLSSNF
jgi:hypothetical protein